MNMELSLQLLGLTITIGVSAYCILNQLHKIAVLLIEIKHKL
jgi:hypothetical protein